MNEKIKIIFVDDEMNILDGLRRMLRTMRRQWDMTFVSSGQEALNQLDQKTFDVIVSDMRMPGMDGAELLEKVKQQFPKMTRIALSGQTSKETILRSVGPVHQYLPKPCNAENLKKTIDRICSLNQLLSVPRLQSVVSRLESLPCIASLYRDLIGELGNSDPSVQKISDIISQDIGMSVKILQLVNSAFFGVRQEVFSINQAVTLLGLETVKALILSVKIFSQFENIDIPGFSLNALWHHSLRVGQWSKLIARDFVPPEENLDSVMIAGMLHDVGKLIMASQFPDLYQQVLAQGQETPDQLPNIERSVIGATHGEMGAYLLGLWGFSDIIIDCLAYHHEPDNAREPDRTIFNAIYCANGIAHEIDDPDRQYTETQYLQQQNIDQTLYQHWHQRCREQTLVSETNAANI